MYLASHAKNPNTIHFDNSVFTRNDKPENIIISNQSQNKHNIELRSSPEVKIQASTVSIENSTGKFKGIVEENKLDDEFEVMDSYNTDKLLYHDDVQIKQKTNTFEPKKPRQVKSAKVNSKPLRTQKNISSNKTEIRYPQKIEDSRIYNRLAKRNQHQARILN